MPPGIVSISVFVQHAHAADRKRCYAAYFRLRLHAAFANCSLLLEVPNGYGPDGPISAAAVSVAP